MHLGAAALDVARLIGAHPADLRSLDGRFASAICPGDTCDLKVYGTNSQDASGEITFEVVDESTPILANGRVKFAPSERQ